MKRTVTILTAALFVSALAMPAFAQSPEASPAAAPSMAAPEASPAMAAPEASPESAATEKKEEMAEHIALETEENLGAGGDCSQGWDQTCRPIPIDGLRVIEKP